MIKKDTSKKYKKKIKCLNRIGFIFLGLCVVLFIIIMSLNDVYCGGSNVADIGLVFLILCVLASIILFITVGYLGKKNSIKSHGFRNVIIVIALFIVFVLNIIILNGGGITVQDENIKIDLYYIAMAQLSFYNDNGYYADDWDELVPDYLVSYYSTDVISGGPYSDSDGQGLEGGDNDDQTWLVEAVSTKTRNEVCGYDQKFVYRCGTIGEDNEIACRAIIE